MNGNEDDEIKITVERIGRRISESRDIKRLRQTQRVDQNGSVHMITEVEKGLNDCGHYADTGGICQICESFTICVDCVKSEKFVCDNCHRICCPNCSIESVFHPEVRYCRNCGLRGLIRGALKRRK
jgi:hypothetical protein